MARHASHPLRFNPSRFVATDRRDGIAAAPTTISPSTWFGVRGRRWGERRLISGDAKHRIQDRAAVWRARAVRGERQGCREAR